VDKRGAQIIFLAVLVFSSTLRAQEILSPTEVTSSPIDELGTRRTTRPTQTVPQEQIEPQLHPFNDALNSLPGVQSRLNGSPTISIRGSLNSAHTLVLSDGAPLNFADGAGFNPLFIANENLDRIVLLRGPASTLFGHDALSGALEFDSEKLRSPKFFESYGSFNETQTFAGTPFKIGSTQGQVTAYQTHTDGNYPYASIEGYSGTRSRNDSEVLRATVSASQSGSDFIQFKTYNLVARQIGSTPGALDFPSAADFNNWSELSYLGASIKLSDALKIGSRSTFKYMHDSSQTINNPPIDEQSVRQGISVVQKISNHEIEVFDDFSFEEYLSTYLGTGPETEILNEFGISDFIVLNDIFTLQPALRFSNEGGGAIPSLGLIGQFDLWKVFANYSEGFSPATISQKYTQSSNFVGNPALSPEHSTEIDLGVERNFDKSILGRLEVFNRDIYNLIATSFLSGGVSTYTNIGHAHAVGAELSAETVGATNVGGSLSYLNNVDVVTNSPIPLSPRVQASVRGTKAFGNFSVTAQDTYWSDYYDNSFVTMGLVNLSSWNTFDIYLTQKLSNDINLRLAALNIFDQERELTLSYPEPRRSFNIMVQGYL
jgi:outer membrane cobalamin receptor